MYIFDFNVTIFFSFSSRRISTHCGLIMDRLVFISTAVLMSCFSNAYCCDLKYTCRRGHYHVINPDPSLFVDARVEGCQTEMSLRSAKIFIGKCQTVWMRLNCPLSTHHWNNIESPLIQRHVDSTPCRWINLDSVLSTNSSLHFKLPQCQQQKFLPDLANAKWAQLYSC